MPSSTVTVSQITAILTTVKQGTAAGLVRGPVCVSQRVPFDPFPMTFSIEVMGTHPDSIPVPAKTSQGIHQELLDLRRPDLDQHPTT